MQKATSSLHSLNLKNLTLAVFTVLSFSIGTANAQSLSHPASTQQGANQSNWLGGGGG